MAFKLVYTGLDGTADPVEWRSDSLTGREVANLESVLGVAWHDMQFFSRIGHRLALLGLLLGRDRSPEEAAAICEAISFERLEAMLVPADDDLPLSWTDGVPDAASGEAAAGEGSTAT